MSKVKRKIGDLALFGGVPSFDQMLHVGEPNIGDRAALLRRINDLLDRRRLTNNGPFVCELEQRISDFLGVKNVIAMNNGTIALEIAIRALNLQGEVIVPSMTFVATAHALQWQQIKPIFCDIDPVTHNIDLDQIRSLITPLTSAILGVHLWGRPCNVDALRKIAETYNLRLLFDAAHAFGNSYRGKMIGGFGNAEVFSFHATKFFNTFEGGAVTTNDDLLAEKLRLMRNFGFIGKDQVIYIGTNGKMDEIAAAMGLTSLESIGEFIKTNRRNYILYKKLFEKLSGIRLLPYSEDEKTNYQYIVLEVDKQKTRISRNQILSILTEENVIVRRYFYPGCHRMEPYRSYQPHAGLLLPQTERLAERLLTLPNGPSVTEGHIRKLAEVFQFILEHASQITKKMRKLKLINHQKNQAISVSNHRAA